MSSSPGSPAKALSRPSPTLMASSGSPRVGHLTRLPMPPQPESPAVPGPQEGESGRSSYSFPDRSMKNTGYTKGSSCRREDHLSKCHKSSHSSKERQELAPAKTRRVFPAPAKTLVSPRSRTPALGTPSVTPSRHTPAAASPQLPLPSLTAALAVLPGFIHPLQSDTIWEMIRQVVSVTPPDGPSLAPATTSDILPRPCRVPLEFNL